MFDEFAKPPKPCATEQHPSVSHASKDEAQKSIEFLGFDPVVFNHAKWIGDVRVFIELCA